MDWDVVGKVDWQKLGEENVPTLLKSITSENRTEREQASIQFEDRIVHPRAGWQAFDAGFGIARFLVTDLQLVIVPFLLMMLDDIQIAHKSIIFSFLQDFTNYSYMDYEGEIYKQRASKIRSAIWAGHPTYIQLLSSDIKDERLGAFCLLAEFKEYSAEFVEHLIKCIKNEKIQSLRMQMLNILAQEFHDKNLLTDNQKSELKQMGLMSD